MFQITSEAVQRWTRIGLYTGFGALAQYGVTIGDGWKSMIAAAVGLFATAMWTKYGSTMNAMLTEIAKMDGVEKALVEVKPELIPPKAVNEGTPANVVAKPV